MSHDNSQVYAIPVILVMGQSGVGKSHFINKAMGKNVAHVEDNLECVRKEPEVFHCSTFENGPVYLVDTPGFNDTHRTDNDVLRDSLNWLRVHGPSKMSHAKFGGILYLIEAGQRRLPMLQELKQIPIIRDQVVVAGTKAGKVTNKEVEISFEGSTASAREAINAVLEKNGDATFEDCLKAMETMLAGLNAPKNRKSARKGFCAMFSRLFGFNA